MRKYLDNKILHLFFLVGVSVLALFLFMKQTHSYLRFSDGAKFADIARNIVLENKYEARFSFFNKAIAIHDPGALFNAHMYPPVFPRSIALSFRIFGISDASVIATSSIYYIASVLVTYLIGKKLFNNIVGIASALVVAFNINVLDYATSGASEIAFIFFILLAVLLLLNKNRTNIIAAIIVFFLMYLTRPQAIIFIAGLAIFMALKKTSIKKVALFTTLMGAVTLLADMLILSPIYERTGFTPFLLRGFHAVRAQAFDTSPSQTLKGGPVAPTYDLLNIFKKLFYNSYNFYRRIHDILSPYLFFTFVIGLFLPTKNKELKNLQITTLLITVGSVLAAALTIPFFRYIHPVVPLVYILGCGSLYVLLAKVKPHNIVFSLLIFLFVLGPSLGVLVVDSRFKNDRVNIGKPPTYAVLSIELKKRTEEYDVVLTNLDTWASWYAERKSVWLPHSITYLEDIKDYLSANTIFVTDYLADDENYFLGEDWKELLEDPESINDTFLSVFNSYEIITIPANDTYENVEVKAVLFKKTI